MLRAAGRLPAKVVNRCLWNEAARRAWGGQLGQWDASCMWAQGDSSWQWHDARMRALTSLRSAAACLLAGGEGKRRAAAHASHYWRTAGDT